MRSTTRRVVHALGLNLVVLTLRVSPPWGGCPIAFAGQRRLHTKNNTTTTVQHAAAMIRELAGWLPDRELHLCADGAYACLAGTGLPRTHPTSRIRRDAALYEPAPPRTGKRGRPRTKGDRLPTPTELANTAPTKDWQAVEIDDRGRTVQRLVHVRDVLWYAVNTHSLVRLVIVRDPAGIEPDDFFVTTDPSATGAQVAYRYAGLPILWLHGLIWCWYLDTHPAGRTWIPRPWYRTKTTPSFLDALAALSRVPWSQRMTAMSGTAPENHQISDALLDTLAYAA